MKKEEKEKKKERGEKVKKEERDEKEKKEDTGECFLTGTRMQRQVHLPRAAQPPSCPYNAKLKSKTEKQYCKAILKSNTEKQH